MEQRTPCVCERPGFCHRHGIDKLPRLWELCRTDWRYFRQWESGDSPQHKLKAAQLAASAPIAAVAAPGQTPVVQLPCIHRGLEISNTGCGGCDGGSTAIYACKIHEECSIDRAADRVKFCKTCTERLPPRMAGTQYVLPHLNGDDKVRLDVNAAASALNADDAPGVAEFGRNAKSAIGGDQTRHVENGGLAPAPRVHAAAQAGDCAHRGNEVRRERCPTCSGHVEVKVFSCAVFNECTIAKALDNTACCAGCGSYCAPQATLPERIVIHDALSPGDVTVLTAAVKTLHDRYPGRFVTDVRTPCPALWESNPHITAIPDADGKRVTACYDADRAFPGRLVYATINACNQRPIHMLEAYCEGLAHSLGLPGLAPSNWLEPSIYLSDEEKSWASQIQEITGKPARFWIVNAGIKFDFTAKRWNGFQEVVDRTKHRVTWVQIGSSEHDHRPLEGVIDLLGKTDLRQLVRLVYHAEGALCGVTALAHLAHWVERGPHNSCRRHAVVIAGGREPPHWFAYPGQHILHTIGEFDCCASGGCWKSRVEPLPQFPEKNDSLCAHPRGNQGLCMESIPAEDVARLILRLSS